MQFFHGYNNPVLAFYFIDFIRLFYSFTALSFSKTKLKCYKVIKVVIKFLRLEEHLTKVESCQNSPVLLSFLNCLNWASPDLVTVTFSYLLCKETPFISSEFLHLVSIGTGVTSCI